MKIHLPKIFGQKDSPWGSKPLGTSTTTIASSGCLLTDVAMLLCYHGKDTDPGRLNDALIPVKGFSQGNRLVYGAITDLYPDVVVDWNRYIECADIPAPLEVIRKTLDEGLLPLLKVDASPVAGLQEHWVLAIGYDDATKELLIFDPWDKAEYWFSAKYGDPSRLIYKIVVYKAPLPQPSPSTSPTEAQDNDLEQEKRMNELTEKVVANTNELRILKDKIESLDLVIGNIKVDTTELYRDREVLTAIKEQLTVVDGKVETNLAKQTTIETSLRQEIRAFGCSFDAKIQALSQRIKVLEERPVPLDNTIKIKLKVGRWFIGKITG